VVVVGGGGLAVGGRADSDRVGDGGVANAGACAVGVVAQAVVPTPAVVRTLHAGEVRSESAVACGIWRHAAQMNMMQYGPLQKKGWCR
jgi:hypothetical protein